MKIYELLLPISAVQRLVFLINLKVLRDNKEVSLSVEKTQIENQCLLGIATASNGGFTQDGNTYTHYSFDTENSTPGFTLLNTSGYGPSAGLLQALSIYNMLTPTDITYGLTIAGTGTITETWSSRSNRRNRSKNGGCL